jgi:hypothetical protein
MSGHVAASARTRASCINVVSMFNCKRTWPVTVQGQDRQSGVSDGGQYSRI